MMIHKLMNHSLFLHALQKPIDATLQQSQMIQIIALILDLRNWRCARTFQIMLF